MSKHIEKAFNDIIKNGYIVTRAAFIDDVQVMADKQVNREIAKFKAMELLRDIDYEFDSRIVGIDKDGFELIIHVVMADNSFRLEDNDNE
jgi:uncharacterized protein YpiB (UPF0302 family)